MQKYIYLVLIAILAFNPLSAHDDDEFHVHVSAERLEYLVEDGSIVKPNTIQKLVNGSFDVFYHGTWQDKHLFHYNWYINDSDNNPVFRVFKCSKSELIILDDDLIILEEEKLKPDPTRRGAFSYHISIYSRQRVLSVDLENRTVGLAPPYTPEERLKDAVEISEEIDTDSLLIYTTGEK